MDNQKTKKGDKPVVGTGSGPGYLETIMIALVIVLVTLFGYDKLYAPKIRTFDLQGFVQGQKKLLLSGEITQKQFSNNLTELDAKLQEILKKSRNRNQIVLMKGAVIKDANNSREIKIQ